MRKIQYCMLPYLVKWDIPFKIKPTFKKYSKENRLSRPVFSFIRGGSEVTVTGSNLDGPANPQMNTTFTRTDTGSSCSALTVRRTYLI